MFDYEPGWTHTGMHKANTCTYTCARPQKCTHKAHGHPYKCTRTNARTHKRKHAHIPHAYTHAQCLISDVIARISPKHAYFCIVFARLRTRAFDIFPWCKCRNCSRQRVCRAPALCLYDVGSSLRSFFATEIIENHTDGHAE